MLKIREGSLKKDKTSVSVSQSSFLAASSNGKKYKGRFGRFRRLESLSCTCEPGA